MAFEVGLIDYAGMRNCDLSIAVDQQRHGHRSEIVALGQTVIANDRGIFDAL